MKSTPLLQVDDPVGTKRLCQVLHLRGMTPKPAGLCGKASLHRFDSTRVSTAIER